MKIAALAENSEIQFMHDDYHKITLAFTTDSSYRILDIAASMEKVPFESCRNSLPSCVSFEHS